jgi:sec-independent protein translocase protein TatB
MFDFNWSHLLIFALVAIVLVPSKDLPALLRNIGKYVGQARRMAQDFRSQVDDALRESELHELQKSVQSEMKGIEESTSMRDTERALEDAVRSPTFPQASATAPEVSPPGAEAAAETAPAVAAEPVKIAAAAEAAEPRVAAVLNGSRGRSDGIEVVRAGRGSLAQRTAAAVKTANSQAGSEG